MKLMFAPVLAATLLFASSSVGQATPTNPSQVTQSLRTMCSQVIHEYVARIKAKADSAHLTAYVTLSFKDGTTHDYNLNDFTAITIEHCVMTGGELPDMSEDPLPASSSSSPNVPHASD